MKMPQRPPDPSAIYGREPNRIMEILDAVADPLVSGKYHHWDKLRYRTPPATLSHEEWWAGLRMRRIALARRIPMLDKQGASFSFALIDELMESTHYIDSLTHGSIQMPEQVTNPETRISYIVRSLIEESITSSQIEGASTTREVAKEMIRQGRPPRDRGEQMILNNYRTMQRINDLRNEPMTKDLLFELHRMVTEDTLNDSSGAGRFRREDESIIIGDDYGETYHVPPQADELEARLATMCDFANSTDYKPFIHPAIRSMILHFWLAYDHPFVDGNGRTARALFYWSMLRHKYWLFEFISISNIILKSHGQYERAYLYTETDNQDLTYFLLYHASVIQKAISKLYEYIENKGKAIQSLQAELLGMSTLNHRQRELIIHALRHPAQIYTYESHRASHGVVHQTARTDIITLVERGLLRKFKRGRVWYFTPSPDLEERLRSPRESRSKRKRR